MNWNRKIFQTSAAGAIESFEKHIFSLIFELLLTARRQEKKGWERVVLRPSHSDTARLVHIIFGGKSKMLFSLLGFAFSAAAYFFSLSVREISFHLLMINKWSVLLFTQHNGLAEIHEIFFSSFLSASNTRSEQTNK